MIISRHESRARAIIEKHYETSEYEPEGEQQKLQTRNQDSQSQLQRSTDARRRTSIEHALAWAYRQGYSFGEQAIHDYCKMSGRSYSIDYNDCVDFK